VKKQYLSEEEINLFIKSALDEDLGEGDHSSLAAIDPSANNKAAMVVKGDGTIAGLSLAKKIFHQVDPGLQVTLLAKDGDYVNNGDTALVVEGNSRAILSAERLVLNCAQRMSGIATYTNLLVKLIAGTGVQVLDTRKTTPGFRMIEKWAVRLGGGTNHRFGLYDMIMLKDNHIDFAGGIEKAIRKTVKYLQETGKNLKIEIETRSLDEVQQVLDVGMVDIIMLDNMSAAKMRKAVRMIDGRFKTEASGGITEESIRTIAECGVDFISVGALTHSPRSIDISLKAMND